MKLPGVLATVRSRATRSSTRSRRRGRGGGIITMRARDGRRRSSWCGALTDAGHIVSLGHSAATYEQGLAGIDAGGRHATHIFNRMPPFSHRAPGLIGAIIDSPSVRAETRRATATTCTTSSRGRSSRPSGPDRTMAITDGTGGAGLPARHEVCRLAATPSQSAAEAASRTTGRWRAAR